MKISFCKLVSWNLLIIIICFILILLTSCFSISPVYLDDDKKIAKKTVKSFHQLYNQGKYNDIYLLCTPKQQSLQTKERFISALKNLNEEAGKVISSKQVKEKIKVKSSHRIVHMFYETKFEKETRVEEFDIFVDGKSGKVDFYGQPEKLD